MSILETAWSHHSQFVSFSQEEFGKLEQELRKISESYSYNIYGKTVLAPRISCLFVPNVSEARSRASTDSNFGYKKILMYSWKDAPQQVQEMRRDLERRLNVSFDYALVHVYRGRKDHIGFHNDEEALMTDVVSLSLGSTRRFHFRPIEDTKGFTDECVLRNGDVVHMKGPRRVEGGSVGLSHTRTKGCQNLYKHSIPKMNVADMVRHLEDNGIEIPKGRKTYKILDALVEEHGVPPVRINLTLRRYE